MTFTLKPGKNCAEFAYVGSRVTCDPAPTDTDRDVLVLCVEGERADLANMIFREGGEVCGDIDYGDDMVAMRLGDDNYLITEDVNYYHNFLNLTAVAKKMNIMDKDLRHAMFKAVIDGDTSLLGVSIEREIGHVRSPF